MIHAKYHGAPPPDDDLDMLATIDGHSPSLALILATVPGADAPQEIRETHAALTAPRTMSAYHAAVIKLAYAKWMPQPTGEPD